MEEFKKLGEVFQKDSKHGFLDQASTQAYELEGLHKCLAHFELGPAVPDDIRGQFNVARNMAIYTYFLYALAPEVHLKTYTVMEYALRVRSGAPKEKSFKQILKQAVSEGWIRDSGFQHLEEPSKANTYCKSLIDILPRMRNSLAHGSSMLDPSCLGHIQKCCDFVNQLFKDEPEHNKQKQTDA